MMIGGAAAPIASQRLIDWVGWRWSCVVFALVGVGWALAFYKWLRDDPAAHPATNETERRLIASGRIAHRPINEPDQLDGAAFPESGEVHEPIPWSRVIPCANVWLLGAAMITMSAMYDVLSSWYPSYLQDARAATQDLSSWLASLVLAAAAFGTFFGGWLTDWLVLRTGSARWGRTGQAVVGAALAALGILASIWTDSTVAASAFVALAAFGVQLQLPSWWASATQVSGRHLGALFGLMNMVGGLGRIFSQLFVGSFADWRKSLGYSGRAQWDPALYAYVVVALLGAAFWSFIDPTKTVESQDAKPSAQDDWGAR
jgi:sugar phosphate permease